MAQIHAALQGLPKPALHFVEALRHSYGYAARASSRGMTGLGKQNCFHFSLKRSKGGSNTITTLPQTLCRF
ncbi:hypothetical protein [Martelella mangrovi]|uniref:hypothetical protein n=1 Tax=Martelella mangrovi TaxID=1397477 RepID=UPI00339A2796